MLCLKNINELLLKYFQLIFPSTDYDSRFRKIAGMKSINLKLLYLQKEKSSICIFHTNDSRMPLLTFQ